MMIKEIQQDQFCDGYRFEIRVSWKTLSLVFILWHTALVTIVGAQEFVLDDSCTVGVLNRTAQVQSDGSWTIRNIPVVSPSVRARFTCVRNNEVTRGVTAYDGFSSGGNGFPSEIVSIADQPTVRSIEFEGVPAVLLGTGATAQIGLRGIFSDASDRLLNLQSDGVRLRSSRASIATINDSGVLTAVASGTVLLNAQFDGTIAFAIVSVAISEDSDGDGILDDLELSLGLDASDPADGLEDIDGDGLDNATEAALGTDLTLADTDSDGIDDLEEIQTGVDGFITNPLLKDSDGDLIPDGLEVATGTDPSDGGSGSLSAVLDSVNLLPAGGTITINSVRDEAGEQLRLVGTLTSGDTVDLTQSILGTTYSSVDPTVCTVDVGTGRISAESDGACIVSATNSALVSEVTFAVSSFSPSPLSTLVLPDGHGFVDAALLGSRVYAATNFRLQTIDLTNPFAPTATGFVDTRARSVEVLIHPYLLVSSGPIQGPNGEFDGLSVVDVSLPDEPSVVAVLDDLLPVPVSGGTVRDVAVNFPRAYVVFSLGGQQTVVVVLDVSDPLNVTVVGEIDPALPQIEFIEVEGDTLYVGELDQFQLDGRIGIYDVSDSNFDEIGSIDVWFGRFDVKNGVLSGDGRGIDPNTQNFSKQVFLFDVSDPTSPTQLSEFDVISNPGSREFIARGDLGFLTQLGSVNSGSPGPIVTVVNLNDLSMPVVQDVLDFGPAAPPPPPGTNFTFQGSLGTPVTTSELLVTQILESEGGLAGASLVYFGLGQYQAIDDNQLSAPSVEVDSPNGVLFGEPGAPSTIRVLANDDVDVSRIEFLVDGQVLDSALAPPYAFSFTPPAGGDSTSVLQARAYDFGGNSTISDAVVLVSQR